LCRGLKAGKKQKREKVGGYKGHFVLSKPGSTACMRQAQMENIPEGSIIVTNNSLIICE
jgi:hypothetical protein